MISHWKDIWKIKWNKLVFFFQHFFESQELSIHFSSIICYVLGHTETFIPKSLSFQLCHADEWLEVFAPRTSVLGLISSMSLYGRKVIQSVKPEKLTERKTYTTFYNVPCGFYESWRKKTMVYSCEAGVLGVSMF